MLPSNCIERDGIGRIKLVKAETLLLILPDRSINGIPDRLGIRPLLCRCSPIASQIKPRPQFRSNAKYHRRQCRLGTTALETSAKTRTKPTAIRHHCILAALSVLSLELPLALN